MKNMNGSVEVVADERECIRVRPVIEHHSVTLQHRAQRQDVVTQLRRTLEIQLRRGLAHLRLQVANHRPGAPLHELTQSLSKRAMLLHRHASHARGRTLVDIAEQAGPSLRLRGAETHPPNTKRHREDAQQLIIVSRIAHTCVYGPKYREPARLRSRVTCTRGKRSPIDHRQVRVGLVVLKHDVEARIELFNPRELQGQGLHLGTHDGPLDGARGRHHLLGARVQIRQVLEVVGEAVAQVLGLAT